MRYIIMCGGIDPQATTSKHLIMINDELIVSRTIRLLKEADVKDIAISSNTHLFDELGVEVIHMENPKYWVDGFYISSEPTCYIYGDVVFSKQAIKTIVETETKDIEFFASAPPFAYNYCKSWAEPFAFKVAHMQHFSEAISATRHLYEKGKFNRHPISWELWQVIKNTPLNKIDYTNYTAINDYTCDIDKVDDVYLIKNKVPRYE